LGDSGGSTGSIQGRASSKKFPAIVEGTGYKGAGVGRIIKNTLVKMQVPNAKNSRLRGTVVKAWGRDWKKLT